MEKRLIEDIYDWIQKFKKTSVKQATFDRLETSYKLMENGIEQIIPHIDEKSKTAFCSLSEHVLFFFFFVSRIEHGP